MVQLLTKLGYCGVQNDIMIVTQDMICKCKARWKSLPALEQEQDCDKWQQRGAQLGANPSNRETPLFALINYGWRKEKGKDQK